MRKTSSFLQSKLSIFKFNYYPGFLDYAVNKLIKPCKEVTNKLIMLINKQAYRRREKLVEALSQLMDKNK